ncbi:hypothetical protein B5S31_g4665 [[Candida] boidinii]|nr:hypothetical protein B5S31_g4665 [[Candida] boidinii]OWB80402.1 hypothetical protein B5S32_g4677 [[Candida] boidinii]
MCRFLIFKGTEPILLSNLLTRPAHSIINQSFDSRLRLDTRRPMNGDGFGLGYYTLDDEYDNHTDPNDPYAHYIKTNASINTGKNSDGLNLPSSPSSSLDETEEAIKQEDENGPCVYKAITPAWNNLNLQRLAEKTKSKLVFAHVRASTYGVLSETNCHPFTYGKIMFMHNGGVSNFSKIKRKLINHIDDEYFLQIQGSTDSECCFALFLDTLSKMDVDLKDPRGNFGNEKLRLALVQTIQYIKDWVNESNSENKDPSLLNFAVTDGESIIVSRYVTSKTEEAASLYFSTGSRFLEYAPGQFRMERLDRTQDIVMIASEPLTFERGDWISVPTNSTLTVKKQTVLLHPIIDQYYESNPSVKRKLGFAEAKGLMGTVPLSERDLNTKLPPLEREGRQRSAVAIGGCI